MRWIWRAGMLAVLGLLLLPAFALAISPDPNLVLAGKQLWALLIGALVPLFTYVLNHFAPWVKEPAKATVLVIVSAVASAVYAALSTSSFGWNSATLEMVVSGVFAALLAHGLLWRPSGISAVLGAGSNSPLFKISRAGGASHARRQ